MATAAELIDRIHGSDPGPEVVAAFDYDGTLIRGFSVKAFYEHRLRSRQLGPRELTTLVNAIGEEFDDRSFGRFLNESLSHWAGMSDEDLDALGRKLFKGGIASRLHREVYDIVEAHRRMGHTLVLVSSALKYQTTPVAEALQFDHELRTEVELDAAGRLTGRALGVPMYGEQKARALFDLAVAAGHDLERSFGYSNGGEDVPLLEVVRHPCAVEPDEKLEREAERRSWPVLRCRPTGTRPGLTDLVRTGAFYGGFTAAVGAGIGVGLLRRSNQAFVDVAIGVGADVSLAVAGVEVKVIQGAEHLWGPRPAVFVFNHSSKMDAFVAMKLLRENFTGVAKAEAKKVPMFGQLFQAAGMAFIERGNHAQAMDALAPVVEKLRGGTSIVLSPEGTRTPTPRLAPFKKGAFHMAMQAGVPMVPILFRGVDAVQWRGAQVVRPGTVEVVVLPPVPTTGWSAETVADHRDEVRAMMLEVLSNWPQEVRA